LDFLGDIVQTFDESKHDNWFDERGVNSSPDGGYMVRKTMDEQVLVPVTNKISDLPLVLKEEWILEPVKEECHMTL